MDDLVTWYRAQLDDDERVAREAASQSTRAWEYGEYPAEADHIPVAEHIERWDPARVLAEVDAKRQLLDWLDRADDKATDCDYFSVNPDEAVRLLALPYADRPGYREEWRP